MEVASGSFNQAEKQLATDTEVTNIVKHRFHCWIQFKQTN